MTTIKIDFPNFWKGFNKKDNFFCNLLKQFGYNVEISNDPDIIIYSVFGKKLYYTIEDSCGKLPETYKNCRKVFFNGESSKKVGKYTAKYADLNLTFDESDNNNNIRFPLWLIYNYQIDRKLVSEKKDNFCVFIYSNNVGYRNSFCKKLSEYKRVDCGGGCLNNIGYKVKDKIEYQRKYKFSIAFENCVEAGYTTEKILEAYNSNCIPIYYGNPNVISDFNPETFINRADFSSDEELIEYIKKVDNDDKLYNSYLNKSIYSDKWLKIFNDPEQTYFKNIVEEIVKNN